ncbi:MAG: bile acid:sodium symporter [Gemmataceae bacterium]|nr:bile acid:sodium symporter [Gemmataceae bacterium]
MFDWYSNDAEYYLSQLQLTLFMLGMGATLTAADFAAIARQPRFFLIGAACQFLLTPLIAVLINHTLGVPAGIAVGIILISAMPGGTLSKVFAYLGRGNIALSIALSICGTFASMATVPALLWLLATEHVPAGFEMPVAEIVRDVVLFLLLPLGLGMTVSRKAPEGRLPFSRWCIRLGFVVVIVMVASSLGSGRIDPSTHSWPVHVAIILFCLLSQQLSMLPFRLRGWSKPDCVAVGMEVTMRNLNLALLLYALLRQAGLDASVADNVLFVILYYAAVAMCCGLPLALNFRRMIRRDAARAAAASEQPV